MEGPRAPSSYVPGSPRLRTKFLRGYFTRALSDVNSNHCVSTVSASIAGVVAVDTWRRAKQEPEEFGSTRTSGGKTLACTKTRGAWPEIKPPAALLDQSLLLGIAAALHICSRLSIVALRRDY